MRVHCIVVVVVWVMGRVSDVGTVHGLESWWYLFVASPSSFCFFFFHIVLLVDLSTFAKCCSRV